MYLNEEITNCTRCGKPFKNFRLQVILDLHTDRLRETGIWEEIPNLCQMSTEFLCEDCFNHWVDIQTQMNITYSKATENDYNIGSNVKGYSYQTLEKSINTKSSNDSCECTPNKDLVSTSSTNLEPEVVTDVTYEKSENE